MGFQKTWALIVGIILAILGVWGLFTSSVLGIGVNLVHSILHLVGAVFGIYVGLKGEGPVYNLVIGILGVLLGVLGFVPGVSGVLMSLLSANTAAHILHLVVGVICLIIRFAVKQETAAMPAA